MSTSRLTPEAASKIIEALEGGNSLPTAAALAGERVETVRGWIRRGVRARELLDATTDETREYVDFARRVDIAIAKFKAQFAEVLRAAAECIPTATGVSRGDWKAFARLAELTYPREFSPVHRIAVDDELRGALDRMRARLTPEEYARALEAISATDEDDAGGEESETIAACGTRADGAGEGES